MSVQKGDLVLLQIGGVTVGGLVSNSHNMSADMLDKTNKDLPGVKQYDAGETGWTLSLESLFDPAASEGVSEALEYLKTGTSLTVLHGVPGSGAVSGTGKIASVDLSGPKNEISSYSLEIQGTGVLNAGYGPELNPDVGFNAWTADDPDGWTVVGEVGTDPEVSEVGTGAGHGDAGTGACNVFTTSDVISLAQDFNLTPGTTYKITVVISYYGTTGGLIFYNDQTGITNQLFGAVLNTVDTFEDEFVNNDGWIFFKRTAACDITIDSISIKEVY